MSDKIHAKIKKLRNELIECHNQEKYLMDEIDKLTKKFDYEENNNERKDINFFNFNERERVPAKIIDFFELETNKMSRIDVIKIFYEYFNENDMYDGKTIKHDRHIRKLLNLKKDDKLTLFNLQSYINKVYEN